MSQKPNSMYDEHFQGAFLCFGRPSAFFAVTGQSTCAVCMPGVDAAQYHLHPDQQVTVILADAKTAKPDLEAAGFEVVPLKI